MTLRAKARTRKRVALAVIITLLLGGLYVSRLSKNRGSADYVGTSFLVPPDSPAIPTCGVQNTADITLTGAKAPTNGYAELPLTLPNFRQLQFHYGATKADDRLYVLSGATGTNTVTTYDPADFSQKATFSVTLTTPASTSPSFAIDPGGNVYLSSQLKGIYKYSVDGDLLWQRPADGPLDAGLYGYVGSDGGFRVAAPVRNKAGAMTYDADGVKQAYNAMTVDSPSVVVQDHLTGDITAGGKMTYVYRSDGTLKFQIGTDLNSNDKGPFHFYQPGSVLELVNGTYAVMDTGYGIISLQANGLLRGIAQKGWPSFGGYLGNLISRSMDQYGGRIYYAEKSLGDTLVHLTWTTSDQIEAGVAYRPEGTSHLGIGGGLYSPNAYVPSGTTPDVRVTFYPWWSSLAGSVRATYTVRSLAQTAAGETGTETPVTIPAGMTSRTDVPLTLPPANPGYYQVDAKVYQGDTVIGAECMSYSVGAPGSTLDAGASLPALSGQLGFKLLRENFSIENLLPADAASADPMNFSSVEAGVKADAAAAAASGVILEIQIGAGNTKEKALVSSGNWQRRVQETVEHFKQYVHVWEAWNEPNGSYGNAASFTTAILNPFKAAVKAADPSATAVCGGILGTNEQVGGYFDIIGKNDGFAGCDAIGFHPYTGHNRSLEEQGMVKAIQDLRTNVLATYHADTIPLWDTESGFWNTGANSLYGQGDKLVRKVVLENSIGITNYAEFFLRGSYSVQGLKWGLITSEVTPGALAMAAYAARIGDRHFSSWVPTGMPHSYAALYAGSEQESQILILWDEDFASQVTVTVPGAGTVQAWDTYGGSLSQPADSAGRVVMDISGQPRYVEIPSGVTPAAEATESFGSDIALASTGTTASATSSYGKLKPENVIDGIANATNVGGIGYLTGDGGMSVWVQATQVGGPSDAAPALTLHFPEARTVDRVLVASQGIASVETGLRSFDLQARNGSDDPWTTVATVRNNFMQNMHLLTFSPRPVTDLKITNMSINYGGYSYGLPPPGWTLGGIDYATIYEVEAYAPGTSKDLSYSLCAKVSGVAASTPVSLTVSDSSGKDLYSGTAATSSEGAVSTALTSSQVGTLRQAQAGGPVSYQLRAKGYLRRRITEVAAPLGSCASPPAASLVVGDFDGDNAITLADVISAIRGYNHGSDSAAATASATFNGSVSLGDVIHVIRNYNESPKGD